MASAAAANIHFDIQREIAKSIALVVRATLMPVETEGLAARPTQNLQAYQHYLVATTQQVMTAYDVAGVIAQLEKAVEFDAQNGGLRLEKNRLRRLRLVGAGRVRAPRLRHFRHDEGERDHGHGDQPRVRQSALVALPRPDEFPLLKCFDSRYAAVALHAAHGVREPGMPARLLPAREHRGLHAGGVRRALALDSHDALLHGRCDEQPVAREEAAEREPAASEAFGLSIAYRSHSSTRNGR